MESISAILIILPVLMPIAVGYGIDPLQFGVMATLNLSVGLITPPYGILPVRRGDGPPGRTVEQVSTRVWIPLVPMLLVLCAHGLRGRRSRADAAAPRLSVNGRARPATRRPRPTTRGINMKTLTDPQPALSIAPLVGVQGVQAQEITIRAGHTNVTGSIQDMGMHEAARSPGGEDRRPRGRSRSSPTGRSATRRSSSRACFSARLPMADDVERALQPRGHGPARPRHALHVREHRRPERGSRGLGEAPLIQEAARPSGYQLIGPATRRGIPAHDTEEGDQPRSTTSPT